MCVCIYIYIDTGTHRSSDEHWVVSSLMPYEYCFYEHLHLSPCGNKFSFLSGATVGVESLRCMVDGHFTLYEAAALTSVAAALFRIPKQCEGSSVSTSGGRFEVDVMRSALKKIPAASG